jgi:hypothetical protein
MASPDQIAANQRNARGSTGPRTAAGKCKVAANNALRHGLTVSVPDPAMNATAARIAAALAGPAASPGRRALVLPIAEAQAELLRIRTARAALINLAEASLPSDAERETDAIIQALPKLVRLDLYERRAMRRRNLALRALRKAVCIHGK